LQAEKAAKGFSCWDQFVAMLFCQLAQAKSLREICDGLRCCLGNLNHLGVQEAPKRSTLSYANAHRPWRLYEAMFTADTSYYSIENLQACKDHEVDAYIPDRDFRKRDPRFVDARRHRRSVDKHKQRYKSKKRWFTPDDFTWDDHKKQLICPAGKGLYVRSRRCEIKGEFFTSYQAPKRACCGCPLRAKCLRSEKTTARQVYIHLGRRPGSLTEAMKQKLDTPQGRKTYSKRLGIVEPVFGNIRACKRMDRFTLRGRAKVNIQWMLYCLVHNIGKIANFGNSYAMAA